VGTKPAHQLQQGLHLRLEPGLDAQVLRTRFASHGRLHIPGFFRDEDALAIGEALAGEGRWRRGVNQGTKSWDIPIDQLEALPPAQSSQLNEAAYAAAAEGFQYLFDTFRMSDEAQAGRLHGDVLEAVYDFVNGPEFLDFVRTLTGDPRPRYCDAQATRFTPGHFLTTHDDAVGGKHRLYAYVLNFTPRWRVDWGGLLLFLNEDGHIAEGYTPTFNALNIFRVPQEHCVSFVAPFARGPRLSITGWIRH
jgi:Rps23 Pro-64 3,4-dihydroxylase Tpa1-like proline 4-hydroxylase